MNKKERHKVRQAWKNIRRMNQEYHDLLREDLSSYDDGKLVVKSAVHSEKMDKSSRRQKLEIAAPIRTVRDDGEGLVPRHL